MQQYQSVAAVTQTQPLHYPTFLYSGVAEGGGGAVRPWRHYWLWCCRL